MATGTTTERYTSAIGRRKLASTQVRLVHGTGKVTVNTKSLEQYFPQVELQHIVNSAFSSVGLDGQYDVSAKIKGGGIRGQAESLRLAISRALTEINPDLRTSLKKLGFLKRDARVKERKKYGHKKARRSPQWSKR